MTYMQWPHKTGAGASYCLDQSPGGDRYGGLTVPIRWPHAETGAIIVQPTEWRTGQTLDVVGDLQPAAEKGVRDAARESGVNLDEFDVVISDFAYHRVDSPAFIYYGAARSAFRFAWEAWQRFYVSPNAGPG